MFAADYEAKIEKVKIAQQRQFDKLVAKRNDPDYQASLIAKQRIYQQRAVEKQIKKQQALLTEPRKTIVKKQPKLVKIKTVRPPRNSRPKGRAPTAHEKYIASKLGSIGCICCLNQGWIVDDPGVVIKHISLHHCDGRVKKYCHYKQLPLCQYHHQIYPPQNAPSELFPFHGNQKRWERVNGSQLELLNQAYLMIDEPIPWH